MNRSERRRRAREAEQVDRAEEQRRREARRFPNRSLARRGAAEGQLPWSVDGYRSFVAAASTQAFIDAVESDAPDDIVAETHRAAADWLAHQYGGGRPEVTTAHGVRFLRIRGFLSEYRSELADAGLLREDGEPNDRLLQVLVYRQTPDDELDLAEVLEDVLHGVRAPATGGPARFLPSWAEQYELRLVPNLASVTRGLQTLERARGRLAHLADLEVAMGCGASPPRPSREAVRRLRDLAGEGVDLTSLPVERFDVFSTLDLDRSIRRELADLLDWIEERDVAVTAMPDLIVPESKASAADPLPASAPDDASVGRLFAVGHALAVWADRGHPVVRLGPLAGRSILEEATRPWQPTSRSWLLRLPLGAWDVPLFAPREPIESVLVHVTTSQDRTDLSVLVLPAAADILFPAHFRAVWTESGPVSPAALADAALDAAFMPDSTPYRSVLRLALTVVAHVEPASMPEAVYHEESAGIDPMNVEPGTGAFRQLARSRHKRTGYPWWEISRLGARTERTAAR